MIYTKSSLQIVQIVEPDKEIPAFNTVTFLPDGGIVTGNRKVFFWISPLPASAKHGVPLDEGEFTSDEKGVTFWADSIKKVVKAIPKDSQFKGLLEHCDISLLGNKYYATINDGSGVHKIELRQATERLEGWRDIFQGFTPDIVDYDEIVDKSNVFYLTMNRKRLIQMLTVLEKVVSYDGNYSPIHMYFSIKYDLLIRCKNEINDQRICIISTAQEGDDYPLNDMEESLFYDDE